jgi:hypothetical protein
LSVRILSIRILSIRIAVILRRTLIPYPAVSVILRGLLILRILKILGVLGGLIILRRRRSLTVLSVRLVLTHLRLSVYSGGIHTVGVVSLRAGRVTAMRAFLKTYVYLLSAIRAKCKRHFPKFLSVAGEAPAGKYFL